MRDLRFGRVLRVDRRHPAAASEFLLVKIGLGATIGYKLSGAAHVVVADVIPSRLAKALAVGADAVINLIVSDRFPFTEAQKALETAATPGAADKVVVTFDA